MEGIDGRAQCGVGRAAHDAQDGELLGIDEVLGDLRDRQVALFLTGMKEDQHGWPAGGGDLTGLVLQVAASPASGGIAGHQECGRQHCCKQEKEFAKADHVNGSN